MPDWSPIYALTLVLILLFMLLPSSLSQWSYREREAINDISPGSPCEYNRDCAIITTGLKCLRGGCHCEYFRAEPYLDWTHPYYNKELHRCVIKHGEVCVYNLTAAQTSPSTRQQGRSLALIPGAGPGRRPITSPASVWKDFYYTCEPETWCDPRHPLLESPTNGVCVRNAAGSLLSIVSMYGHLMTMTVFTVMTFCLKLLSLRLV